MCFEHNSVIWLRESIRRIFFRIHLVDLGHLIFAILTDKGLADTEMFGGSVIDLLGALKVHPLIIGINNGCVNLNGTQLS